MPRLYLYVKWSRSASRRERGWPKPQPAFSIGSRKTGPRARSLQPLPGPRAGLAWSGRSLFNRLGKCRCAPGHPKKLTPIRSVRNRRSNARSSGESQPARRNSKPIPASPRPTPDDRDHRRRWIPARSRVPQNGGLSHDALPGTDRLGNLPADSGSRRRARRCGSCRLRVRCPPPPRSWKVDHRRGRRSHLPNPDSRYRGTPSSPGRPPPAPSAGL